jgi:hypothetical protein
MDSWLLYVRERADVEVLIGGLARVSKVSDRGLRMRQRGLNGAMLDDCDCCEFVVVGC